MMPQLNKLLLEHPNNQESLLLEKRRDRIDEMIIKNIVSPQQNTNVNYNRKDSHLESNSKVPSQPSNQPMKDQFIIPKILNVYSTKQVQPTKENYLVLDNGEGIRLVAPPSAGRKTTERDPLAIDEDFNADVNTTSVRLEKRPSVIKRVIPMEVIDIEREEVIKNLSRNGVTLSVEAMVNGNAGSAREDVSVDGKFCL